MKNKLKERFSHFTKHDIVSMVTMSLSVILGLYMSIGMSVSIAQGKTLFGDSSNHDNQLEIVVSSSDYIVLALFWILTVCVFALLVYYLFFKKQEENPVIKKEIVEGKTVIVKEDKDDTK